MRFRYPAVLAAAAMLFAAFGLPAQAGAGKLKTTLSMVGPQGGGGEPSIAAGPGGVLYASWPGDKMYFARSTDGGRTWKEGGQPSGYDTVGDTTVFTDHSGAVYETNLNVDTPSAPLNSLQISTWKSFDKGKTWPQVAGSTLNPGNSSGQPLLVDRQWNDAWIPPGKTTSDAVVALTYHDFGPSQIWVSVSTDGAKTFGVPVDVITDPAAQAASFCSTIPGGLRIVPGRAHAGRIYVAWLAADPTNVLTGCNVTQLQAFHTVWVAWSDDVGKTWTDQLVYDAGPLHDGSELFADLAVDNQGNPYVAFPMNVKDEYDIFVESSLDGGKTWNGRTDGTGVPVQVNSSTGTHYFPAIDAGRPGQVVVSYIATSTNVGSTPEGKPNEPLGDADADWFAYLGQTTNLGTTPFTNVQVSPQSIHHGDVCTVGIFCSALEPLGADRSLLDFIDVVVDSGGYAHVVFTAAGGKLKDGIYAANQVAGPSVGPAGH
ncbi:MAG: sialidase family protein [Actinomycetota bacterium]